MNLTCSEYNLIKMINMKHDDTTLVSAARRYHCKLNQSGRIEIVDPCSQCYRRAADIKKIGNVYRC